MDFSQFKFWENKPTQVAEVKSNSFVYEDLVYGQSYPIVTKTWNGEKTLGELGVPIKNVPDYKILRVRSYDAYAKSDIVKIVTGKYFDSVVGSGLKLQLEPNRVVLKSENIEIEFSKFQKIVEARFEVYAKSKEADYLKLKSLHKLALGFYEGQYLGGDNLCVLRFDQNGPNVQFISGEHLRTPLCTEKGFLEAKEKGNRIEHGVELDKVGKHVAYHVCVIDKTEILNKFVRIPAKGTKSNKTIAWLIGDNKISPDHIRSVPRLSQSLEKITKLDRYTESAVSKAEQAANVVNTIIHDKNSTGESPYDQTLRSKRGDVSASGDDAYVLADGLANRINRTTAGQTYNMPIGSKMESFSTDIETNFSDFHGAIFNIIASGLNIPPEIAMQMFNSNYSASRAAINAWSCKVSIERESFANQFYVPFFKAWFEFEVLSGKISAPKYVESILSGDFMVTDSYTQSRFTGQNTLHIDPLKEAKSIELLLTLKLISREQATEMLGLGQWDENFLKSLEEDKIIPIEKEVTINTQSNVSK